MAEGNGLFKAKIAGEPAWLWIGAGGVVVGGLLLYRRQQKQKLAQSQYNSSTNVPSAATSEELMAAGLYQPPSITYNVPPPNIDNGISVVPPAGTPPPTPPPSDNGGPVGPPTPAPGFDYSSFGQFGQQLESDIYGNNNAGLQAVQSGTGYWSGVAGDLYNQYMQAGDPNPYQHALATTEAYAHDAAVSQGSTQFPIYGRGGGAARPRGRSKLLPLPPVTVGARTGIAPQRAFARRRRLDVFNPLSPSRGARIA